MKKVILNDQYNEEIHITNLEYIKDLENTIYFQNIIIIALFIVLLGIIFIKVFL